MAKGSNQKLKLLFLAKILMEQTDEAHGLSVRELIAQLRSLDINAERKTIYADLEELRHFGMDIICEQEGKKYDYRIGKRKFELAELKLLVDSVQAAKFITEKKSQELIRKLEGLASVNEAAQLQRQVYIAGRVKTANEKIYYNVDKIYSAIGKGVKIRFQYYRWNVKKEMELRHNGTWYEISPWGLVWDDEYYYMVGYERISDKQKHYRVDKMLHITLTDHFREGSFEAANMPSYSKRLFGMFSGDVTRVTLEVKNSLVGVLIDRFGKDIPIMQKDREHFVTCVDVAVSSQFLGWIMALGDGIKITAPDRVVERMREEVQQIMRIYFKEEPGATSR